MGLIRKFTQGASPPSGGEPPSPPIPPSQPTGSGGGGSKWKRWHKITLGVVGVLIVIIVLTAIFGSDDSDKESAQAPAIESPTEADAAPAPAEAAPEPAPTPEPAPEPETSNTFGDGDYRVPQDLKPGTYRTREDADFSCYYATLKNFSGDLESIMANANTDAPAIVTIPRSAGGFTTQGCAEWTDDLSQITSSRTAFEDGMFFVGVDIAPGAYRSSGEPGCYFARLNGFDGSLNSIIANENTDTPAIVQIARTDRGFISAGCGSWRKT